MNKTNLIIGKPDSGKTRGILFPIIEEGIKEEKNFFVIDNKEEYYNHFQSTLKESGYETYIINLNDTEKSNGINLLRYPYKLMKENKLEEAIKLLQSIAKNICKTKEGIEAFWENTAADYLMALFLILFQEGKEEEINLYSLTHLISYTDVYEKENIENLRNYINQYDVTNPIYRLASSTIFAPLETRNGIISTLKTALSPYIGFPNTMNLLSTNDLDMTALDEKVAIFFTGHDNRNFLANSIMEQLLLQKNKKEFIYILDNMNKIPEIPFIDEFIEYATKNKTITYFITNNQKELEEKYPRHTFDNVKEVIHVDELKELKISEEERTSKYPRLEEKNHHTISIAFLEK